MRRSVLPSLLLRLDLELTLRILVVAAWVGVSLVSASGHATPLRDAVARPRIAIVLDDVGAQRGAELAFTELGIPITFSLLPNHGETAALAFRLELLGFETMLHLPAEPLDHKLVDGPGFLTLEQRKGAFLHLLARHLARQPLARGVNLHMGSRLSQNVSAMRRILRVIRRNGMFFLDSRTIASSVAYHEALQLGLVTEVRDHFLDHTPNEAAVLAMLNAALRTAREQGQAIVIGHPLPATLAALRRFVPRVSQWVEFVPLSRLVSGRALRPRAAESYSRVPGRLGRDG